MKSILDNLLLAGCPIFNNDLITQTLSGLDIEYNPIVVQLSDKIDLIWVDMQATLLTFESRLEQLSSLTSSFQLQANIVQDKSRNNSYNSSGSSNAWHGQNQNNQFGRSPTGHRRGGRTNNNRPVYQVCRKTGHPAAYCYFRYDQSSVGSIPGSNNSSSTAVNNQNTQINHPTCIASASTVADPSWYMDSGVSAHITNNHSNLDHATPSYGQEHRENLTERRAEGRPI